MIKMKLFLVIILLLLSSNLGYSQHYTYPSYSSRSIYYCDIIKIERTSTYTKITFRYYAPSKYENGGWVCAGANFFIRDTQTKNIFKLIEAFNIPICPSKHNFNKKGETLEFVLSFEALPNSTSQIDVIEDYSKVGFEFYSVNIPSSNSDIPLQNNSTTSTSGENETLIIESIQQKSEPDIEIKSIFNTPYYTQINFSYFNNESKGRYILLYPPGHSDAYFIRANGKIYKLLSTQNIANTDQITAVYPGNSIQFSAKFEKLPSNTLSLDLIEGITGSWNFKGIKLKSTSKQVILEKFSLQYDLVQYYDFNKNAWAEKTKGNNVFIFNINENGDIEHKKGNGKIAIYKNVSVSEEYKTNEDVGYQFLTAKDENNKEFKIQLFNNASNGIILVWEDFIVGFSKQ